MPKMGGIELITALKSKAATANIPIVIVASRQAGFEDEKRVECAVYKDIDIKDELAKALEKILGAPRALPHAAGR
jgi:CheY-like chemotaxis protein